MVLLTIFDPVEEEEFEMQQEFLDHYLSAPVAGIFTTCGKQPVPETSVAMTAKQWLWEHIEPMAAVAELYKACDDLIEIYKGIEEKDVKPAFAKYDKDGSGAIDKDELSAMSAELGNPLDDEQLETALKDLDLNGDGVVDIDEFKRWFFSGMKSYSSTKRTMLKYTGGMA